MTEKRVLILSESRIQLAEFKRQDWVVDAEDGTTVKDLLEPGYWSHIAAKFKPFDHIEVINETGSWVANLMVIECHINWARVKQIGDVIELEPVDPSSRSVTTKHRVKWMSRIDGYGVVRIGDGEVVMKNFGDKAAAQTWMENHERSTAA